MTNILQQTTKAQVSGHKFLTRRVEHGLVLGDIRMISDPFAARRRASIFGLIGVVIIAVGSGVLAVFAPQVDPGDAPIIRVESGALYVRLPAQSGTALHPVANLASARLIVGKPEEPAKATAAFLDGQERGAPVGIVGAPGLIATHPQPAHTWSAVHSGIDLTVVAGPTPPPLADDQGVLARSEGRQWIITAYGRSQLPPEDSPLGRVVRRRLGITVDTPTWQAPPGMLAAVKELPPMQELQGTLLEYEFEYWLERPDGLVSLTQLQFDIGRDMGLPSRAVIPGELANFSTSVRAYAELPTTVVNWQDPGQVWALGDGKVAVGGDVPPGIGLAGTGEATRFSGPSVGGIGVDTGHGVVLVTDTGRVHRVESTADAAALGIESPEPAPWPILKLLPEGDPLSAAAALQAQF